MFSRLQNVKSPLGLKNVLRHTSRQISFMKCTCITRKAKLLQLLKVKRLEIVTKTNRIERRQAYLSLVTLFFVTPVFLFLSFLY